MSLLHFDPESGNPCLWCPGCKMVHVIPIRPDGKLVWQFNGDNERPTFEPSLLLTWPPLPKRCHVVVTGGVLNYCADCTHALAGKSIPMVEWRGFDPDNYEAA